VPVDVKIASVAQTALDEFVEHGGDAATLFMSGEHLTIIRCPAGELVGAGMFTAPSGPGSFGILATIRPGPFAYERFQVHP
jgi:hypothetical protein